MRPNSRNAGTASLGQLDGPGASTRPTSKSKDAGPISTVPSTKREEPSTSCCAPSGTSPRPKPSSGLLSGVRADCRLKSRSTVIRPHIAQRKEALDEHPEGNQCKIRSSKYLNNLIEQDHRSVKLRLGPMLGLKHFRQAATTIAGIELMHRIRKGQFKLGRLPRATRLPRFGMRFSLRDPTQLPGACLARPQNVCTTTFPQTSLLQMLFQRQPSWHGSSLSQMPRGRRPHHQSKFYTACPRTMACWSSTVFARELPPRSAGFNAENRLYSFALTRPSAPHRCARLRAPPSVRRQRLRRARFLSRKVRHKPPVTGAVLRDRPARGSLLRRSPVLDRPPPAARASSTTVEPGLACSALRSRCSAGFAELGLPWRALARSGVAEKRPGPDAFPVDAIGGG